MKQLLLTLLLLLACSSLQAGGQETSSEEFLKKAFQQDHIPSKTFWIDQKVRSSAENLAGHPITTLRVRYWQSGTKTAWILNEIGKEMPITIGVVIENNAVHSVEILAFRESRGGEIRHSFFTEQFRKVSTGSQGGLNKTIDGITGATLSVAAVKRAVTLALYFNTLVQPQ